MTSLASASLFADDAPEGHLLMVVIDSTGDSRHSWDKGDPAAVEAARGLFDTLTGKGHQAFKVTRKGEKGERIRTFDPDAEAIIFAPALQGG